MKVLPSKLNQSKANKVNSHLCEGVAVGVAMACGYNPPRILDSTSNPISLLSAAAGGHREGHQCQDRRQVCHR